MKVRESERVGLKLNIQKMKIMASGPITSWQIDGETMELVTDYFFGLQNHCRWWLPPWNWKTLTPWKKSYNQPRQHIKKHIFANNVCLVKAMVFPAVMYGCESWTIHKAELWRIDAFELWCLRVPLLRVPWTAGDQTHQSKKKSVLNIHWKEWCWSWNSNTLATWCKELTELKRPWCWERLKVGEGDDRGWNSWMASPTQWTWI